MVNTLTNASHSEPIISNHDQIDHYSVKIGSINALAAVMAAVKHKKEVKKMDQSIERYTNNRHKHLISHNLSAYNS